MLIRTGLFCAAMGIAAFIAPTPGSARVYLDVNVAPPAAQVEVVPVERRGYAWAPGYYNWSGHEHVWVGGRYIKQRSGHHWVADRWEQHGDSWRHEPGRWDHD
jgi:WXXGXW repeat (2 copies)